MNHINLTDSAARLHDLYQEAAAIQAEIAALEGSVQEEMANRNWDNFRCLNGKCEISIKTATLSRVDTQKFKKSLPDLASLFTKEITTHSLSITWNDDTPDAQ